MGDSDKLPVPKDDEQGDEPAVEMEEYGPLVYLVGAGSDEEWFRFRGDTVNLSDSR